MKKALVTLVLAMHLAFVPLLAAAQSSPGSGGADSFKETVLEAETGGVVKTQSGEWRTMPLQSMSGGAVLTSDQPGAVLEFAFTGAAVAADMVISKSGGRMAVSVDGRPVGTFDLYRGIMGLDAQRMALANNLAPGAHTLRIEVLADPHPKSFGSSVAVDTLRSANAAYGSLSGVLECRYNQGLPVTRARVSAINPRETVDLVTGVEGKFVFDALAPGQYTLRFERPGFEALEQSGLSVDPGQARTLPAALLEEKPGARPLTFIRRPLGVLPVIVRPGDVFPMTVQAPATAADWQAALENPWANTRLELKNAAFDAAAGRWTLSVAVPADASPLLYGLRLSFNGGEDFQPRAVSVVPEFKDSLRVVHLTDVHVYKSENLFEIYPKLADEVNLVNPDLIVVTGDLTDSSGYTDDRWPEADQYPPMLDLWNAYHAPTFIVPGNHDLSPFKIEDDYLRWNRFFDTTDFSFDAGPYHFTAFDNTYMMKSAGHDTQYATDISSEHLAWIEQDLAKNADAKMRILLFHVPLHQTDSKVKDLAARHDVRLALYGHLHMNAVDKQPPTTYVQTGAAYDGSYRIVNLDNGKIGDFTARKDGFSAFTIGMVETLARRSEDGRSLTLKARNAGAMAIPGAVWREVMPTAKDYTCDGCSIVSRFDNGGKSLVIFTFDIPAKGGTTAVLTAQ